MRTKAQARIFLTLLLLSMLSLAFNVHPAKANPVEIKPAESYFFEELQLTQIETEHTERESKEQIEIIERRISPLELQNLKQEIGVWEEGRNYKQTINGHGTGLRPPTEQEWMEIANKTYMVEEIVLNQPVQHPSSIDLTAEPWFPPIGDQDGEGSCVAWAVGYYTKTFQEAKEHEWDLSGAQWIGGYTGEPTPEYQDRISSPDFIYHLTNGGTDQGSDFFEAISVICAIGVSSWEKMPYNPLDSSSWPSEEAWREATLYRGNSSGYESMWLTADNGLTNLRNWLASEHLAVISINANEYSGLTGGDLWTLDNYLNPGRNHANTIVGYDDNIEYLENGEMRQGAFKIANSWGIGRWENVPDGCYWMSYEVMKQHVRYCMFYRDRIGYKPDLVSSFRINHSMRVNVMF